MSAVMGSTEATPLPARTIPVALGDGIGPEIMAATLRVLRAADPALTFHEVPMGLKAYEAGHGTGITPEALDLHVPSSLELLEVTELIGGEPAAAVMALTLRPVAV